MNLPTVHSSDAPKFGIKGVETFRHVKLLALSICNGSDVQRTFRQLSVRAKTGH